MPYGIVNTDTVRDSSGGILAPISSVFRNRIINGAMVIDQRNAGASLTLNGSLAQYGLDRFAYNTSQASKLTAQQSTTVPTGFYNSNLITVSSAATIGSGDYFTMFQHIEANNTSDLMFGTVNAKTVTLSFWVRSSVTGTFVVGLLNAAINRSYLATYTISVANTWEYKTITIAGDTTGTWTAGGNGVGITVRFDLGSGSSGMGTANTWQAGNLWSVSGSASSTFAAQAGATFYITGVQLEVGSSATGFEYVNYQTSLANCQRYCYALGYVLGGQAYSRFASGVNGSTTNTVSVIPLPVTMRTIPSFTWTGGFTETTSSATGTSASITTDGNNINSAACIFTYSSGTVTQFALGTVRANNSTTWQATFSAEL